VVKAEVGYQNNVEAPGMVTASTTVQTAADVDAVVDNALRLIWHSRLNPLSSIHIGVMVAEAGQRGSSRDINVLDRTQKADLDRQYGARP
jgi:hypothetical protein